MHGSALYAPLRLFSFLVLLLMLCAIIYGGYISVTYWSGIGV